MKSLEDRVTLLPVDNIDTDRIIPARFLTTTDRKGLGRHLFEDWPEGSKVLDGGSILVAGHNFGCGSSREHAVWSLADRGIRAVVATSFADIFHANALRNGLSLVVMEPVDHAALVDKIETSPDQSIVIDFDTHNLSFGSFGARFTAADVAGEQATPGGAELDRLIDQLGDIERWEAGRRPRVDTRGSVR